MSWPEKEYEHCNTDKNSFIESEETILAKFTGKWKFQGVLGNFKHTKKSQRIIVGILTGDCGLNYRVGEAMDI